MATTRKKAADEPATITFADKFKGMEVFMSVIMISIAVLAGSAAYAAHNTGSSLISEEWGVWQSRGDKVRWCRAQNVKQMTMLCSDCN